MPLKNRRGEYSWGPTRIGELRLMTDKKAYSTEESVIANLEFKLLGGMRNAFAPDVWTVAWEDFDKIMRLTMKVSIALRRGLLAKKVAEIRKEVRKASFYWSRDPDLPYRIWAMVVPEDGGPPIIPTSVEDAKSKMLDVSKTFTIPAATLGMGSHSLVGSAQAKWGRRSFIEKGEVSSTSKPLVVRVE